jgi:LmbE family N-acetylglucosaminyl deacetylase
MIREALRRGYRTLVPLLYARTNFKLFLKTTFTNVDFRVQQLAAASDYFSSSIQPIPLKAPFGRSMVVIAPHQDDETIGCGGVLALQVAAKASAYVVMMQDGADEYADLGMARQALMALRNEESRRAAAVIGMEPPRFLSHPDLAAAAGQAADQVREILRERHADAVFVPFFLDGHYDHRTTNSILAEALRGIDWEVRVFCYEVWGLCVPNVIVVIDQVMDQKLKMLSCFDYANKAVDYVHSTKGLNMYYSRMLGAGVCRYAERFLEIPRQEYIELIEKVRSLKHPGGSALPLG